MKKSSNLITNCTALLFALAFALSSQAVWAIRAVTVDLAIGNDANDGLGHPVKTVTRGLAIANSIISESPDNYVDVNVEYNKARYLPAVYPISSANGEIFPLQVGARVRLEGGSFSGGGSAFPIVYRSGDGEVAVKLMGDQASIEDFSFNGFNTSIVTSGNGATTIERVENLFSSRNQHFIKAGARETQVNFVRAGVIYYDTPTATVYAEPWADIQVDANKVLKIKGSNFVTTGITVGVNGTLELDATHISSTGTVITADDGALVKLTNRTFIAPRVIGAMPNYNWEDYPNQTDSTSESTIVLNGDASLITDSSAVLGDDLWVIDARDTSQVNLVNTYLKRLGDRSSTDPNIGGAIKIADGSLEITKRESSGLIIPLENTINIDGGTAIYVSSEFAVISLNDLEINAKNKATGIRFDGTPTIRAQLWKITFNGLRYGYLFQKVTDVAKFNIWNNHFNTVTDGSHDAIRMSYCRPGSGTMNVLGNYFFPEIQGADATGRYTSGSKTISGPTTVGTLKNFALLPNCSVKVRN